MKRVACFLVAIFTLGYLSVSSILKGHEAGVSFNTLGVSNKDVSYSASIGERYLVFYKTVNEPRSGVTEGLNFIFREAYLEKERLGVVYHDSSSADGAIYRIQNRAIGIATWIVWGLILMVILASCFWHCRRIRRKAAFPFSVEVA